MRTRPATKADAKQDLRDAVARLLRELSLTPPISWIRPAVRGLEVAARRLEERWTPSRKWTLRYVDPFMVGPYEGQTILDVMLTEEVLAARASR